uniref:Transcriptional regulator, AraC family n=1 Tax=Cyanothece sp. (strain PCC 7425 / ATCC 29141) TaxID=395961 RepID=B8HXD6_CYAP4
MAPFIPLVRVNAILPFVSFLGKIGAPTQRYLNQARIPILALENPENLIPLYLGCQFIENLAHHEGTRALGIEMGLKTSLEDLGVYGRLLRHSLTLFDLFKFVEKTIDWHTSGDKVNLKINGDKAWICHRSNLPNDIVLCHENHYATMFYYNVIRLIADPAWQPEEIHFVSKKYCGLRDIDVFSNTQISFEQSTDAICFPRAFLSRSLRHFTPYSEAKRQEDKKLLQVTAPALDFPRSTQQVLRFLLRGGHPKIELVAEIAGMSVRSFQRYLAAEGLTYIRMVEQVRFDAAVDYLEDPDIKIIEIALELGYQDPANFTRAFKRWTGISPQEYRELHCNR